MANGFGSLHVGASGLQGAQNGLNVVANNISNVDTEGYVRQQVLYEDKTYLNFGQAAIAPMAAGIGVAIGDVVHTRDVFLDKAYRSESGRQAFYESNYQAAMEVETMLNENNGTLGTSFATAIADLYEAFSEFSKAPADEVNQNLIAQKADLFISRAQAVYQGLYDYQKNINKKISDDIDRINDLGKTIHELNINIQKIEAGGIETAMDLRDARDSALDELSSLANISYKELPDGIVKVKLEGTDFVIESRAYQIDVLTDGATGFVTPYWPVLSDPSRNDYYEVFDVYNSDPVKNTDIGEVKALLLARGEGKATYLDMLETDFDRNMSVDDYMYTTDSEGNKIKKMMGVDSYESGIANSIMCNEQTELDTLIHDLVVAINNLVSPIKDYTDTTEYEQFSDMTVTYPFQEKRDETTGEVVKDPLTGEVVMEKRDIVPGEITYYDAENNLYLTEGQVRSMIVFDKENSCVGSDFDPHTEEGLPPKELFSRVGCDRYRKVIYSYMEETSETDPETGDPIYELKEGTLYVYNEEGYPRVYDEDEKVFDYEHARYITGVYVPDKERCYTLDSVSVNAEVMDNPSLIAHRHQNDNIAYDLGADIYALWESQDCMLNPADETKCGFAEFYSKMVGELATVGSVYKTTSESLESTKLTINNNRQMVLGVSTDEELQTMIKYQNAYNASSRYINVVSEMIQTIITSMGA